MTKVLYQTTEGICQVRIQGGTQLVFSRDEDLVRTGPEAMQTREWIQNIGAVAD